MPILTQTYTIAAGEPVSDAVQMLACQAAYLYLPEALEGTNALTIGISFDGVTFADVFSNRGVGMALYAAPGIVPHFEYRPRIGPIISQIFR